MTKVYKLDDINRVLPEIDLIAAISDAFTAYSAGRAVVPPVGDIVFDDPPGEAYIKSGYLKGDRWFVIKVATGFFDNPRIGLPSNSSLMLIFNSQSRIPHAILLDEGQLTNIRTAAAGALAAKLLAPKLTNCIWIIGSGIQARMQLEMLKSVTTCRRASVYARDERKAATYADEMTEKGFEVAIASSPSAIAAECNLIMTTTPSNHPILFAGEIHPGAHITAVGSDMPDKNEIDANILAKADLVVADSVAQCSERGEIHHALKEGAIALSDIVELGILAASRKSARPSQDAITLADLTGVAVQDIAICKAVLARLAP